MSTYLQGEDMIQPLDMRCNGVKLLRGMYISFRKGEWE